MIQTRLFRRYYFATALIVLIFIVLGYGTAQVITRFTVAPGESHHPVFYAKLLDHLNPGHRAQALEEFNRWNTGGVPYRFAIVDRDGTLLYPPRSPEAPNVDDYLSREWDSIKKPQGEYDYQSLKDPQGNPRNIRALIRFSGEPAQYLYVALDRTRGRPSLVLVSTFVSLVISVLLGIGVAMILVFRSLRERAVLADSVLAELQRGNLKARFPIGRMDEIGMAMSRFNRMADEIERLVERLKSVEKSRMTLLQELAHDLRTPVASLKNMLETMQARSASLDPKIRDELLSLSVREAEYFERLVEDLLVLAQVTEPRYRADGERVDVGSLLEEEAESVAAHSGSEGRKRMTLRKSIARDLPPVQGDAHLLRRMIRNALDNAFSFAEGAVTVSVDRGSAAAGGTPSELRLEISDDGAGFTPESLAAFGERRASRVLGSGQSERLSVGLGSVIMRTVAQLHRGRIEARNGDSGGGATIVITLPVASR